MLKKLHLAKLIITNDKGPIMNGALLTAGSKVVQVGTREDFGTSHSQIEVIDHGDSLICPGFINLHAHLLYSNTKKISGKGGLFPWLEMLFENTCNMTEKELKKSVQIGISESLASGTTFVVENTPTDVSIEELSKSPLKSLIGVEVFGSDTEKANDIFTDYKQTIDILQEKYGSFKTIDFTLSPHAAYDVSAPLWKKLTLWAEENNKLLLAHLEESPQEKLWWRSRGGPCTSFWGKINKLEPKLKYWKRYESGVDFLYRNELLSENILATHLSQASDEDLAVLRKHNVKLVHCPRSNHYLGNGISDLRLWQDLGFLWGIGTDSLSSNQDLDLLSELRFAMDQQNTFYNFKISAEDGLKRITSHAARILSKDHEMGSLKCEANADFLVFGIEQKSGCTYNDPYHLLVFGLSTKNDLKDVWISGERVWIHGHILHTI